MIDLASTFPAHIPPSGEFEWLVPDNLPYFDGHFPGRPILPAIAIVDANIWALQKLISPELRIKKILTAKFSAPILPGTKVQIKIQSTGEATWFCEWCEISNSETAKTMAQMTLLSDLATASAAKV